MYEKKPYITSCICCRKPRGMKKLVLVLFFILPLALAEASLPEARAEDERPVAFPNPASDFIGLSNDDAVQQLVIYNFSGREVCSFRASKGQRYNVSGLPSGMYLVQFLDAQSRIFHTQRLQKR